eukprot:TRINITY_DN1640_c1_g3_i2.p1 TRINITY_DN1640_c1_g3~~TRINITY_DN1640_c1_g3_i2.p1  ORF type:complete len:137 (+),score=43.95 TRINITY_DN1640_c1_g3_i2:167-577(+)
MSLGVGGATVFSQGSNHQTAHNHQIRDTQAYDHTKQTKVKCTSCGMWAVKGANCGFCKHPTGADRLAGSPKAKAAADRAPAAKEKKTVSNNALTHEHRDITAYKPQAQTKVKCASCGMWAKKGGNCGFCKRPVAAK